MKIERSTCEGEPGAGVHELDRQQSQTIKRNTQKNKPCWQTILALVEALELALEGGRKPQIFHSDQGCKFTSAVFVSRLHDEKISISWSGRNHCYDKILVERLWRTVKYEEA